MNIPNEIASQAVEWRQYLHQNPELGFEEYGTSSMVAEALKSFGVRVHTGIAGTGVVGVLTKGDGTRSIGIRADMDALPMQELNDFAYSSKQAGKCMLVVMMGILPFYSVQQSIWQSMANLTAQCILSFSQPKRIWVVVLPW